MLEEDFAQLEERVQPLIAALQQARWSAAPSRASATA